ncbi:MAG TPA: TIGR03086 family metal-binding protein [Acidimicrobiales bacterium]|nr:TIGR03086 family metal-binding protein [Acidimicrobiales bacterium]
MTAIVDLEPAARRLARLVEGVPDRALGGPTPCRDYTVGDLVEHIGGAARSFRASAVKQPLGAARPGDASRLGPDWRTAIPRDLLAMAEAWKDPEAWAGMTGAGGIDLPGEVAGVVGLDELVIHGWDLARATGQPDGYDGPGLEAVHGMVSQLRAAGVEGIFGPPVEVAGERPLLERILGLTGRDPDWRPPA